jgi:hypothetical protein
MVINGKLVSDSPWDLLGGVSFGTELPTRYTSQARILLLDDAKIQVNPTGSFELLTDTYVDAHSANTLAVVNMGSVKLLGRSKIANHTFNTQFETDTVSQSASLGSLTSRIVVFGEFVQTAAASTTVYLNHTRQETPVMYLINSANYSGSVFIKFYTNSQDSIYPDLLLYDEEVPSKWSVIAFRDRYSSHAALAFDELALNPPTGGLLFSQYSGEYKTTLPELNGSNIFSSKDSLASSSFEDSKNTATLYTWDVQVDNIACDDINNYYFGVPQQDALQETNPNAYVCWVCLQNSSCNLCNGVGSTAGQCAVAGSCGSAGVAYGSTCCSGGCNGKYGSCEVNADHTSFTCDCSRTIWYTGSNCKELSPSAYVVIFSGVSLLLTLMVMGFFYHRSLQQKRLVLDELADGLLNHNADGVNHEYIQYMQQALILNDVFVKWEEITLESVVGEGSFGVVHKATFRGAQVAVKQMRSMFTELTDKEIDEFRKEAYVMSR